MPKVLNLIGKEFDCLTVISKTNQRIRGIIVWLCKCKCGKFCTKTSTDLRHRVRIKSCGCSTKQNNYGPNFQKILLMKEEGYKVKDIAKELGISLQRVYQILEKSNA